MEHVLERLRRHVSASTLELSVVPESETGNEPSSNVVRERKAMTASLKRSYRNAFPAKKAAWRVCASLLRVVATERCTLYATALQPTRRGAFCRADRKKSYQPGDLSLVVASLDAHGALARVASAPARIFGIFGIFEYIYIFEGPPKVAGALRGAELYDRGGFAATLRLV